MSNLPVRGIVLKPGVDSALREMASATQTPLDQLITGLLMSHEDTELVVNQLLQTHPQVLEFVFDQVPRLVDDLERSHVIGMN